MKRLTLRLPLVLLIAIFAAGCGGGDDDSTDSGTTGSAGADKSWFAEADQFCAESNGALEQAAVKRFSDGQPSRKQAIAFVESEIVPSYKEQLKALRKLTPPDDQQEDFDKAVIAFQSDIEELEKDPGSVLKGNVLQGSSKAATELGLLNCGTGGTGNGGASAG